MMKIGIVERDGALTERLSNAFSELYPGEAEFLFFPTLKKAQTAARKTDLYALLLDGAFESCSNTIPKQCKTALLTENRAELGADSLPAVYKYQSVDDWHAFFAEFCKEDVGSDKGGDTADSLRETKRCLFTSGGGGVGASAAAAAFSEYCAVRGISVLYLCFDIFPATDCFLGGEKKGGFDDVLYALRHDRHGLRTAIDKAAVKNESGVWFISPVSVPTDMFSLSGEDIVRIVDEAANTHKYRVIVIDVGFETDLRAVLPFIKSDKTALVCDGSETSKAKTDMVISAIFKLCGMSRNDIGKKLMLLYNRYDDTCGSSLIENEEIGKLGGIGRLKCDTVRELIKEMSECAPFEKLAECLYV